MKYKKYKKFVMNLMNLLLDSRKLSNFNSKKLVNLHHKRKLKKIKEREIAPAFLYSCWKRINLI